MKRFLIFIFLSVLTINAFTQNKFTDPVLQKIYTFQDERNTAALLPYLKNKNESYREAAALAFASVQDVNAIDQLLKLLKDNSEKVRLAAAYSIGQTKDSTVVKDLINAFKNEQSYKVKGVLYEALGKSGTRKALDFIVSQSWYPENTAILAGQARGLFWLANKKITSKEGTIKALDLLTTSAHSDEVRLAAAHYFARAKNIDLAPHAEKLTRHLLEEDNVNIQMALARSLDKIDFSHLKSVIPKLLQHPDYRVQVNTIYALRGMDQDLAENALMTVLVSSQHPHVTAAAAEALLDKGNKARAANYYKVAGSVEDWRTRALLLAASLRYTSDTKAEQSQHIMELYKQAESVYEKGLLLTALGQYQGNHRFIADEAFSSSEPVIRTYATEALTIIRRHPAFGLGDTSLFNVFAGYFKQALESNDVAMIAIAGDALRDTSMRAAPGHKKGEPKVQFSDISFMEKALKKLTLPRDIETYMALQRTIDFYKGKETKSLPVNVPANPIDWKLVSQLIPEPKVVISTTKGDIYMLLLTEHAPGSVGNFVLLADKGFYNDKAFHRVVPNFVAQTGCPRGDGWGNTDHTIRSEFAPLNYGEGYVGMASAGKDTEGSQWFITHSPAPHLDGNYTIFGKIIEGMDIVQQLEMGDKIISIEVKK